MIAIWPQRRWRVQRDALTRAYASLGTDAGNLATDPDGHVHPEALITLREAFTLPEGQARRRPPEYRGWYGLPERIAMTLSALGGRARSEADVAGLLTAAAQALAGIAGLTNTARRDTDAALVRLDAAVASLSPTEVPLAQRLSRQLQEAAALHLGDWQPRPGTDPGTAPPAPRRFNPMEGAADTREFDLEFADISACSPAFHRRSGGNRYRTFRRRAAGLLDSTDGAARDATGDRPHLYPLRRSCRGHLRRSRGRLCGDAALAANRIGRGDPGGGVSRRHIRGIDVRLHRGDAPRSAATIVLLLDITAASSPITTSCSRS